MRIRKITFTAQTSFVLGFGLAAAGLFQDSLDNGPRGAWSDPPVR